MHAQRHIISVILAGLLSLVLVTTAGPLMYATWKATRAKDEKPASGPSPCTTYHTLGGRMPIVTCVTRSSISGKVWLVLLTQPRVIMPVMAVGVTTRGRVSVTSSYRQHTYF